MRRAVSPQATDPSPSIAPNAAQPPIGKHTLTAALAPVQPRASGAPQPDAADVHASAQRGIATPATALPHAAQLQQLFGRHDLSGVQAHVGPDAAASARAMGATAYATGHHVVLGDTTDLHTVAHEAAHVVQQRGGVQLKGGVGEVGDEHERHADEVADRVVRGESAEAVLDRHVGRHVGGGHVGGGHAAPTIQRHWGNQDPGPAITGVAAQVDEALTGGLVAHIAQAYAHAIGPGYTPDAATRIVASTQEYVARALDLADRAPGGSPLTSENTVLLQMILTKIFGADAAPIGQLIRLRVAAAHGPAWNLLEGLQDEQAALLASKQITDKAAPWMKLTKPDDAARLADEFRHPIDLGRVVLAWRAQLGGRWTPFEIHALRASPEPIYGSTLKADTALRPRADEVLVGEDAIQAILAESQGEELAFHQATFEKMSPVERQHFNLAARRKLHELRGGSEIDIQSTHQDKHGQRWLRVDERKAEGEGLAMSGYVRENEVESSDAHRGTTMKLYPSGQPTEQDVKQGNLGDCYLLSALSAIARQRPAAITQMIVDRGDTVAVRFFRQSSAPGQPPTFVEDWVAVERSVVVASGAKHPLFARTMWVAIVEKAYAAWAGRGHYGAITGGQGATAMQHLLGEHADHIGFQRLEDATGYRDLASFLAAKAKAGPSIMTIGSKQAFSPSPHPQLMPQHNYELLGLASGDRVRLRNPHGIERKKTAPEFTLSVAEVEKYFEAIDFTGGAPVRAHEVGTSGAAASSVPTGFPPLPKPLLEAPTAAAMQRYLWDTMQPALTALLRLDATSDLDELTDALFALRELYEERAPPRPQDALTADLQQLAALIQRADAALSS